jgi:hypothetical protein
MLENELKRSFFRRFNFNRGEEKEKLKNSLNKLISVLEKEFVGADFNIPEELVVFFTNSCDCDGYILPDEYFIHLSASYHYFNKEKCKFFRYASSSLQDIGAFLKYDVMVNAFVGILMLTYLGHVGDENENFSYSYKLNHLISPKDKSPLYIVYYPSDATWEIISSKKYEERIVKMQKIFKEVLYEYN